MVVDVSKSQHPGRHSVQEPCKAVGDLKLSGTWLTHSLFQQSPDSGKVAIIPADCNTEIKVTAVFTRVAVLSMQKSWQRPTTINSHFLSFGLIRGVNRPCLGHTLSTKLLVAKRM